MDRITPAYLVIANDQESLVNSKFISDINSNEATKVKIVDGSFSASIHGDEIKDVKTAVIHGHEIKDVKTAVIIVKDKDYPPNTGFNFDEYFGKLKSERFGKYLLYQQLSPSTHIIIEPFTALDGLVVVAKEQTNGIGRCDTKWESPVGCAMFSVHLIVDQKSMLGQHFGFAQHLMALAAIKAIKQTPGLDKLDINLKWPNVIHYSNHTKIGGILVTRKETGNQIHYFIGMGLNVSNSKPTTCLNDIIKSDLDESQPPLTVEEVIVKSLNEFDQLMAEFESQGVEWAKDAYKSYWLHSNQKIALQNGKQVVVTDLDDQGELIVQSVDSGEKEIVHSDCIQLDMKKNRITPIGD